MCVAMRECLPRHWILPAQLASRFSEWSAMKVSWKESLKLQLLPYSKGSDPDREAWGSNGVPLSLTSAV